MSRFSAMALALTLAAGPAVAEETLLILGEGIPATLNVDGAAGNHAPTQTGLINVLERLVDYQALPPDENGVVRYDFAAFAPALAESWQFDPQTLTWTLNLRRGVKGCNGATFDAEDVLYSFARAKSLSGQAPVSWFIANVASIDGFTRELFGNTPAAQAARTLGSEVTKVDDYTVQIRQRVPNRMFLMALTVFGAAIYDKETMQAHATAEDPWSHRYVNTTNGPSFGPWCVEEWRKDEVFTVRANADYWRGKPAFDRVIYRRVPQSANRFAILRSGRAQIVEAMSPKELSVLARAKNVTVAGGYLNGSLVLLPNWRTPPWDNEKVRQALAFAIPYEQIAAASYFENARPWNAQVPTSYPGFHQPPVEIRYDPERARALLAEAGFPNGAGLERFEGAFKIGYAAEREGILGPSATLLRSALRKAGFPVELDPLPAVQLADRQLVKKDLPLGLYDGTKPIGVDAAYALLLLYVSPPRGLNNITNFSDAEVDALYEKIESESDAQARNSYLAQAQSIVMRRLALVPILEFKQEFAFRSDISGITLHPTQQLVWYAVRPR
jgi:peptide/nickel transport system substrate-binding protein